MSLEIFKLVGSIFVDNEAANQSISKTDEKAQGVGTTLLNGAKTAAKWSAGVVAAAGAVATGLGAVANNALNTLDNVDKMSQKIGISKEAYQELSYVMGQNGIDVDILQSGMKKLTTELSKAKDASDEALVAETALEARLESGEITLDEYNAQYDALYANAYKSAGALGELGLSLNDIDHMGSEEALYAVISALQGMDDEVKRTALASELLGKSATELAPLLNAGAGNMAELTAKAHELGLVMSDDAVNAGVVLGDTISDIKQSVTALGTKLGSSLVPILQSFADIIVGYMPQLQALFDHLAPVVVSLMEGLLPPLLSLVENIFPVLISLVEAIAPTFVEIVNSILPVIVDLVQMLMPPLVQIVQKLLPPLLELLQPLLELLSPIMQLLQPILDLAVAILDPLVELISGLLTPLVNILSKLIEVALVPLKSQFTSLSGILSGTVNAAFGLIMNQVNTVKGVFSGLIQFIKGVFTGDWKSAWEGVKKVFSSIWEGIKTAFKIPINWIIDGINGFIKGINSIQIPDWVPLVGGKGFNIDTIPRLAAGGVLEKGQTGFLEGNGAEAVVPLENNRKWISAVARDMSTAGVGASEHAEKLLGSILDRLEDIVKAGITLDTGALVGGLARPMDRQLGLIAAQKARA